MNIKRHFTKHGALKSNRWLLMVYDFVIYAVVGGIILFYNGRLELTLRESMEHCVIACIIILIVRLIAGVYRQIWRYGGIQAYILLLAADGISCAIYYLMQFVLPVRLIGFTRIFSLIGMNLLGCLSIRMIYRYIYKTYDENTSGGKFKYAILKICGANGINYNKSEGFHNINIAILGAGSRGVALSQEMLAATRSPYMPQFFVDTDKDKIGRLINDLYVFDELDINSEILREYDIQEVIIAIQSLTEEDKKNLYYKYKNLGCRVKIYDVPSLDEMGSKKIREIDPEELLFRKQRIVLNKKTEEYYKNKTVLITGGGGSIGSELCRQLAKMSPKKLVILDIYENGAYDVQQEIRMSYHGNVEVCVEIASICDKEALKRVFEEHGPQIVIMAAAHKHVPLMEKNCIEAVNNNVFGTLNTVETSEEYGVERVIMVSTDKAVNPTNIMGATKRMCELIVQAYAARNKDEVRKTTYSLTRFGNVLGSAGSVIPLFKKQIANGGPVTVTDRNIIRYFMTIPEASQLVLESGAMANNGELFVLDMGQPVKIYELAQNLIQLSGAQGIDIIETGLRPGEKLYEEVLIDKENIEKTENELIFIEREQVLSMDEISDKLDMLKKACGQGTDSEVKAAMREAVPTYMGSSI